MSESVSIEQLLGTLAEERALDLRAYKRSTLQRRINKRMGQLSMGDYSRYLDYIRSNPGEVNTLLNTVLINVTEFFRDPQAWEYLRQKVLPALLRDCKPGDSFRSWCAGCASGEEVYSLGILLAEHLGSSLGDFEIRIYATDVDEEALNIARRAEYSADKLSRIRPEWRNKYFQPVHSHFRVNREIRRMVIFGRGNLVSNAPISHVNLIICRNVLIYFSADAQKQILSRLYYALERNGVLFFGKAESQLTNSRLFVPLSSRWRIFRRAEADEERDSRRRDSEDQLKRNQANGHEKLKILQLQQQYLLETLGSGVITLDAEDVVTSMNDFAARAWAVKGDAVLGKRLQQSDLGKGYPELVEKLESTRRGNEAQLRASIKADGEERTLSVVLKPMLLNGERQGTLIHCDDVTHHDKLQATVEQLETTGEELQAANEELETTNEELQSTNEELETTNEELQSTNEELETTNEELHSLNEELENMNEELETRTRELDALNLRYSDTLERMPWPVMVVGADSAIQFWNTAAQNLFGISARSVVGIALQLVPLESDLRKSLLRGTSKVLSTHKPTVLRTKATGKQRGPEMEIRFEPLSPEATQSGVLIMLVPFSQFKPLTASASRRSYLKSRRRAVRPKKKKR
jgi:two-component system, chemotaxis family, CheB/CheR fusion protein